MTGIFLVIIFTQNIFSQDKELQYFADQYRWWGFTIKPLLYQKAQLNYQYGSHTFKTKNMPALNIGFEFNINPHKEWSFKTGLLFGYEPTYYFDFTIKKEDLLSYGFTEDLKTEPCTLEYLMPSLSVPISIELKRMLTTKTFFNVNIGLKFMIFPPAGEAITYSVIDETNNIGAEVFGSYADTSNNQFYQTNLQMGAGVYFLFDKMMIQTNIVYNKSFKDLFQGEFQFDNLDVSEPTRGYYKVSGDYIGLSATIYLKKRVKKNRKPLIFKR